MEVQAIYYVLEGTIYQAPTVRKLIKSRLQKFTHHLNNAFGKQPCVVAALTHVETRAAMVVFISTTTRSSRYDDDACRLSNTVVTGEATRAAIHMHIVRGYRGVGAARFTHSTLLPAATM